MFDRRAILIWVITFLLLILISVGTIYLMDRGIFSEKAVIILPIVMVLSIIAGWIILGRYQRNRVFRPYIESILSNMGFELILERPLTLSEFIENLNFKPKLLINGMPVRYFRYISINYRILHVYSEKGIKYQLYVEIMKTWGKEYKINIKGKRQIN